MSYKLTLFFMLSFLSFKAKADTFTITMSTLMDSPLRNSGWTILDTLGNVLAFDAGIYDDSITTTRTKQVTISGGPYIFSGQNNTMNSLPIYDWVLFEVTGSFPFIQAGISFFDNSYVSEKFWASSSNPVGFGNLEVVQDVNFNYIRFNTFTENNCEKFILQESNDLHDFVDMDELTSKSIQGFSNVELHYEFRNTHIQHGKVFYRIKQVDYDGKTSFSKIAYTDRKAKDDFFKVYPNPILNELNIEFEHTNASFQDISMYDITGHFVKKIYSGKPMNKMKIHVENISSGMYFIQTVYDDEITTRKLVFKK